MLRGGVEGPAPTRVEARHRSRKHHTARGHLQRGQRRFRSQDIALDIHREQLVKSLAERVLREVREGKEVVENAGVADKGIQLSEGSDRCLHGPLLSSRWVTSPWT